MMDPLSAVGLAGSIVQFVDFGCKIIKRLREFSTATGETPATFVQITKGLKLLLRSVETIRLDESVIDEETKVAVAEVIDDCIVQAKLLDAILKKTLPTPEDSSQTRAKKALLSFWQDKKVEKIRRILFEYQGGLLLHLQAQAAAKSPARRSDVGVDQRLSVTYSRAASVDTLPRRESVGEQWLPPSPRRILTTSDFGSPEPSIFDDSWSIRSASTTQTDVTTATTTPAIPPYQKLSVLVQEPSDLETPTETQPPPSTEETPLLPPPAINRSEKTIQATM
jgi:hypothetical protein